MKIDKLLLAADFLYEDWSNASFMGEKHSRIVHVLLSVLSMNLMQELKITLIVFVIVQVFIMVIPI